MIDPRIRFLAGAKDDDAETVVKMLDQPTIRITVTSTQWRHQVLLYVLVDLLGRIFPRIDVVGPLDAAAADKLPPGGPTIGARLAGVRARSPLPAREPGTAAITVHVGPGDDLADIADVYVDASEWQSYLGRVPSRLSKPRRDTAIGPLAAACRAGARVYSLLLEEVLDPPAAPDELYMSAMTYRSATDPLVDPEPTAPGDIDTLLVGAGSVGGAAGATLQYEPTLTGRLGVCDFDAVDDTNPYRAILATATAATAGGRKVDEVVDALVHHEGLEVVPHDMTITEYEAEQPAPVKLPLVLVAVDTRESRERIQDALPLEVVNAAVGGNDIAVSGHRTGNGPCMCCLHMPAVLNEEGIKNRLIAKATGIPQPVVNALRVGAQPLNEAQIRGVERHQGFADGALAHHVGSTLDVLYEADLLYGETAVTTADGTSVAVASPFVTALAGVLLAGEALKRSTPELAAHALGSSGPGVQYRENVYSPENGYTDRILFRSDICLCRSVRRLRVLADLHGLDLGLLTA